MNVPHSVRATLQSITPVSAGYPQSVLTARGTRERLRPMVQVSQNAEIRLDFVVYGAAKRRRK
ncbi:hypothetical protein SS50377_26075 [Spironucleus salmonicida]|uniref:Uncharacterized protein n=1 Tax=Spironucleus salmonicida TaxID=348837 RepID=A0A9P8LPD6_9EUKA|nr:hypothetical protein SS50377_26075 [Spironucleus salmonicida]